MSDSLKRRGKTYSAAHEISRVTAEFLRRGKRKGDDQARPD